MAVARSTPGPYIVQDGGQIGDLHVTSCSFEVHQGGYVKANLTCMVAPDAEFDPALIDKPIKIIPADDAGRRQAIEAHVRSTLKPGAPMRRERLLTRFVKAVTGYDDFKWWEFKGDGANQ